MNDSRVKVISDVATDGDVIGVKPPFSLHKDKQRRYVRLQISEPVDFTLIKDRNNGFWPSGDGPSYHGAVLNISAGGVLITAQSPVEEGSVLSIRFTLQDTEIIDNVIGVVKRADHDDKEWLIGIEFVAREYLADIFSTSELDVLPEKMNSFDEGIKKVLNKYVYRKRIAAENH